MGDSLGDQWRQSRHGSHSGRGYHYQDAVAAHIAVLGWAGVLPIQAIVPEGHEDISIKLQGDWIHAQAKSRRSHRGDFTLGELIDHLVKMWSAHLERIQAQPHSRVALILERAVRDLPSTDWNRTISDIPALVDQVKPRLLGSFNNDVPLVDGLLAVTFIIYLPDPREPSVSLISGHINLPAQACTVHYEALRSRIAELADENGIRTADRPAQLSRTDVQRIFDVSTEVVDTESLNAAIRDGICEAVDFLTPVYDEQFYEGIDVKLGHVVAGLTIDRPEIETEVLTHLEGGHPVIIVGPSGAGKSAVAWMSAYESRHSIRWYRVRRLSLVDLTSLLRLIHANRPTEASPIGLLVDDLGRADRDGWDSLVAEAANIPGVRLLGIIREEDLHLVQSAYACHEVRPALDENLAERLWSQLSAAGSTAWAEWREPYELSDGLLLEYGYVLTTGKRLGSIIASQVQRRIIEERDVELRVLRFVAAADVWGVEIELPELRSAVGAPSDEQLQRALVRLLNEHLVQQSSPGVYGGLHRVRSQHIVAAIHLSGVPSIVETASTLLLSIGTRSVQTCVASLLSEGLVGDSIVIDSLVRRLEIQPSPDILISSLQALRIASFIRSVSKWIDIFDEEGVPASKRAIAAQLALSGLSSELLTHEIQSSIQRIMVTLGDDLRVKLLSELGLQFISQIVEQITEIESATLLLAALMGLSEDTGLISQLRTINLDFEGVTVESINGFLSAARVFDISLAHYFVAKAGGSQELLARIERETPWVRSLQITTDEEGRQVVEGAVRHVSRIQTDIHEDVVNLCRLVLGVVPDAEVAACRAIDVSGTASGFNDYHVAEKCIPRRNLPSDAEVAWNRARSRTVATLLAAQTHTQRLIAERSLLTRVSEALLSAANVWCRGQSLPSATAQKFQSISAESNALPPPPFPAEIGLGPLDQGTVDFVDPVNGLISGIVRIVARLFDPNTRFVGLAADIHDNVLSNASSLIGSSRWRLLSDPPNDSLLVIERTLVDLHAAVAELHLGAEHMRTEYRRVTRRSRGPNSISLCARESRERAERRLDDQMSRLTSLLGENGLTVRVVSRTPQNPSGLWWPVDEVLVMAELGTVFEWPHMQNLVVGACHQVFETGRTVIAAPLRAGKLVPALSGRVQSQFFPIPQSFNDWSAMLGIAEVEELVSTEFAKAMNCLVEISGVLGGTHAGRIHEAELAVLKETFSAFNINVDRLHELAETDESGLISDSIESLERLSQPVQLQLEAFKTGEESVPTLALDFLAPARNEMNENVNTFALFRMALIELDIEPQGARERIDLALEEYIEPTEGEQF